MNPLKWLALALGAAGVLLAALEAYRDRSDPLARWAA